MPLSDVEKEISKVVVRRFITEHQPTSRRSLLRQFKAALPEALNRLVNLTVLKIVPNVTDAFLPWSLAFQWSGDPDLLRFGKHSAGVVLRALHNLFEQELEHGDQREYTQADIEAEAKKLNAPLEPETIRVGLYLAEEFGVFVSM